MITKAQRTLNVLAYRLSAIDAVALACQLKSQWDAPVPIQIYFDGRLQIQGLSTAYTNPVFEAGIVHSRVLLEFLGLRVDPKDHQRLKQRNPGRKDDALIEGFVGRDGRLGLVSPAEAVAAYSGPAEEAECALAYVCHAANKGIAHSTLGFMLHPEDDRLIDIAVRGIRALFAKHFYGPLGLKPPTSGVNILSSAAPAEDAL